MTSSCQSLILFLPLFYYWHFRRLDSVQFLSSLAHIPAGWRLETWLDSTTVLYCLTFSYNDSARNTHRKHSLCCWGMFIGSLPNNVPPIVAPYACVGMCLPNRCLVIGLYITICHSLKMPSSQAHDFQLHSLKSWTKYRLHFPSHLRNILIKSKGHYDILLRYLDVKKFCLHKSNVTRCWQFIRSISFSTHGTLMANIRWFIFLFPYKFSLL
jgi:hypothetical protein